MAIAGFLYVNTPVASLQFDVETEGTITLDPSVQKQSVTNRLPNGKLRVIIFGLNQVVFSGKFATTDKPVIGVSNVVGSKLDGTNAGAMVSKISPPTGIKVSKIN
jgi:hypothetical protein